VVRRSEADDDARSAVLLAYAFSIGTRELDNSGSWRIVIALGLVFCLILGVGIFFVPESPRWLIEKGRTEEARRGMARVRGLDENHPLVNSDFDEQWAAHELDKRAGTGSWAQCFLGEGKEVHNKAPYRTMVMIVMMAFQQLTGANVSPEGCLPGVKARFSIVG
jgi:SP family sugar:H+ symporter-like MFS transporter